MNDFSVNWYSKLSKHVRLVSLFLIALMFSGCITTEKPLSTTSGALTDQGESSSLSEFNNTTLTAKVSGGFVATVEDLPEKSYNGKVVVLCSFQSTPFVLHMSWFGHNITSEDFEPFSLLEVDKAYYFEIEEQIIENLMRAEFELYKQDSLLALLNPSLGITIISVREPTEDEYGPDSWNILFEEV